MMPDAHVGVCGDGVTDPGETCDGDCPTSCDDANACTTDALTGTAAMCDATCGHTAITACASGDGCCAPGCNNTNDDDCAPVCGNGVLEAGEGCDGNCPTSCNDGNACTADVLTGSAATCNATCGSTPITQCASGDGCCVAGCNNVQDSDCPAVCGNGVVETGEQCDAGPTGSATCSASCTTISQGITIPGTWISHVTTAGTITAPVVGTVNANIDMIVRLPVTQNGSNFDTRLEICKLSTVTTPNASSLTVTYTPAVIATLQAAASVPSFKANVGDPLPLPAYTILSGLDASMAAVDMDSDGNPGVTMPINIGGILSINAYVGLTITTSMTSTVASPNTATGSLNFGVSGIVFGSNNAVLQSGNISVTPASTATPFSATHLDGNVPCSSVITMF